MEGGNPQDFLSTSMNSLSISPSGSDQCSELPPSMQINGRKIIGPPLNWSGPPPSNCCELYINKIPKDLTEYNIVPHFERFGQIYEFRLMLDFTERNRGYGYVKYTTEEEASRAREVMNHFYILPGKLLDIQRSYDKCRLFVGNIPKNLSKEEIEDSLRGLFPKLENVVMHNRICDGMRNRGFVFIDFPSHQDALEVKKRITPGTLRKWGRDLKIVWANPERHIEPEVMNNVRTLFVRNIDFSVNTRDLYSTIGKYIPQSEIVKISRVREFAFIDLRTREGAQRAMQGLKGTCLQGHKLELEWALPPSQNSVHSLKNNDFDADLRLKCIANYWSVPIIIFGRAFQKQVLQYAAVMLRFRDTVRAIFMELRTSNLADVHSRLCEVVVGIIESQGGFPAANYLIKVEDDCVHVAGAITDFAKVNFIVATNITQDLFLYWDEIRDLSMAIGTLSEYSHTSISLMYENALNNNPTAPYIEIIVANNRIFGCISPSYRNKPSLRYGINNQQIILALCNVASGSNYVFPQAYINVYNFKSCTGMLSTHGLQYSMIRLLPTHFVQSKNREVKMPFVFFGPCRKTDDQIELQAQFYNMSKQGIYCYQNM